MKRILLSCLTVLGLIGGANQAKAFETASSSPGDHSSLFSLSSFTHGISTGLGYDSNALLVPSGTPFFPIVGQQDSVFVTGSYFFNYTRYVSDTLSWGISGNASVVGMLSGQPGIAVPGVGQTSDYNRFTFQPKVFLRYNVPLEGGRSFSLTPSYSFRYEAADIAAIGSKSHQLRVDARYGLSRKARIDGHILYADNSFNVFFPGLPTRVRDGEYTEFGLSYRRKFNNGKQAFRLGLVTEDNDSTGNDWKFDGTKVFAGLETHLGGRLFGDFGVAYTERDYNGGFTDIIAAGRWDQDITDLSAKFTYVIDARRALIFEASHSDVNANHPAFAGSSNKVGITYTWRFE